MPSEARTYRARRSPEGALLVNVIHPPGPQGRRRVRALHLYVVDRPEQLPADTPGGPLAAATLAYSLLADALGDIRAPLAFYTRFVADYGARLAGSPDWELPAAEVRAWVARNLGERERQRLRELRRRPLAELGVHRVPLLAAFVLLLPLAGLHQCAS